MDIFAEECDLSVSLLLIMSCLQKTELRKKAHGMPIILIILASSMLRETHNRNYVPRRLSVAYI